MADYDENEPTFGDIAAIFDSILQRESEELYALRKEELERRWFYRHNSNLTPAQQLYNFIEMLELYKRSCRQWETHHNGSCMVVERVRDQYLMPKIKEFLSMLGK
jgi:hypothetical protein